MDALAAESHFLDHLAPIWSSLPASARGRFLVDGSLIKRARAKGIDADVIDAETIRRTPQQPPRFDGAPALVASIGDVKVARRLGYGPFVFLEHGAGQTYGGRPDDRSHASYSGGPDHDDVGLFLVPNETVAERWRRTYPAALVAVVGSPKVEALPRREYSAEEVKSDLWTAFVAAIQTRQKMSDVTRPTVTVCVAHAITDVNVSALAANENRGTSRRRSTTGTADASFATEPFPSDPLLARISAVLISAMAECTTDSRSSCQASAISAERPPDLKWLSDGTLQRSIGSLTPEGLLTLWIPTITFGSVSLAMSGMTPRDGNWDTRTIDGSRPDPVICTSFHWPAPDIIGWGLAGTAWPEYREAVAELAKRYVVIGHQHPNWLARGYSNPPSETYAKLGIPFIPDFEDVCRMADVYVCDNSSTIWEFAATGRPVVVVNATGWAKARGKVEYGLRFWSEADVGVNCDRPQDLVRAVEEALADDAARRTAREAAVGRVYAVRQGGAELAATAIQAWLAAREEVAA